MYIGRGRSVRIAPGTDRRGIRGARFLVRADAASALSAAVAELRRARFAPDPSLPPQVAAPGSAWIGKALTIGRPASRWSLPPLEYGDFPLNLVPVFWPRVALTLAIACARTTDAGAELVIYARPSMLRAGERTNDSGPLMRGAYEGLQRRFSAAGILLHHEPVVRIEDDDCPASGPSVRQQLGWS